MHFAVHGQTAAEVIYNRADAEKEFMGLKIFEGNKPHLKDAVIAKNFRNLYNSKEINLKLALNLRFLYS